MRHRTIFAHHAVALRLFAALTLAIALSDLLAFAQTSSHAAQDPVAKDARLGGDATRTRFVTDLSKEVRFAVRTLADPYRVIIDLSDVQLSFPTGRGKEGRGLVKGYRYGRVEPFGVRIILDVNAPVLIDKASIWKTRDGHPPRLVVELVRTDRKTFLASQRQQLAARSKNSDRRSGLSLPQPPKKKKALGARHVIVIDPGHGGIDPGAHAKSGLKEKDVVFQFSQILRKRLEKTGHYEVKLTRSSDTYIPLRKRVDIAREISADLFVSVHADALPGKYADQVSGATVYSLSEKASDDEAKVLAAKENKSDIIAGVEIPVESDDVANILIDLALRETKNLSISFAETLLDNLHGKTKLSKRSRKYAGFRVLKAPDVPSVLLELGYMTNAEDVRRLQSAAWKEKIADAMVRAIDAYFAKQTARNPY
jgi:N-acetylmuramoyl-L-alanine amidase